jgi:hypothetical protein
MQLRLLKIQKLHGQLELLSGLRIGASKARSASAASISR